MTSENQLVVEAKPESLASLPVLPLKNSVLFPHLFMPLSAGRPVSMAAVEAILATEEKTFLAVALKNPDVDQPTADDLFAVGTRAVVKKMARSAAGIELLVQGVERVSLVRLEQTEPYLEGTGPPPAAARGPGDRGRGPAPGGARADGQGPRAGAPGRWGSTSISSPPRHPIP